MPSKLTLNLETLHCLTAQPQMGTPGFPAEQRGVGQEPNRNESLTTSLTLTWD